MLTAGVTENREVGMPREEDVAKDWEKRQKRAAKAARGGRGERGG